MLESDHRHCHSRSLAVIPSEARNLALTIKAVRDSSSPAIQIGGLLGMTEPKVDFHLSKIDNRQSAISSASSLWF